MKALSFPHFPKNHLSIWELAKLLLLKPETPNAHATPRKNPDLDLFSDLNFFQDEVELDHYLQSFRE